jgi:uncharacterized protein (DUF885 family)
MTDDASTTRGTDATAARRLADRFWDGLLEVEPLLGTQVGDERFDERLPDPTDAGLAARETLYRGALEELALIDRDGLAVDLRTTMSVLEAIARRELDSIRFRLDRLFAANHLLGPGQLLADVAQIQRVGTPERMDRFVTRLRAFPAHLDAMGALALEGAASGQVVPTIVADRAIAQVERLLAIPAESSPALVGMSEASEAERARVIDTVRDEVMPGYRRYLDALREYRPSATDSPAMTDLPDGAAMYASQILAYTTLPLEAKEVHQTGLDELAGIEDRRSSIAERLGHPSAAAAIAAHQETGANTAASREDLVRIAEEQVQRGWDAAPAYFGRLPKANCVVKQVEEFREKDTPVAFYQQPTADGSRPGAYYINTGDLDQRPLHQLAGVTYHEANPGHHFQVSIEQEFADRPALRRFGGILAGSAFAEGWGLYCERLADEMGLYLDDYERLGMLDAQAWRANRLVVDTGIHALGWTRDRAIDQMTSGGNPRAVAEIEVDRYIAWPGQALSYKIGQLEIQRLRQEAAGQPGFSLRDFHDRVLALGSLPLTGLRRELSNSKE